MDIWWWLSWRLQNLKDSYWSYETKFEDFDLVPDEIWLDIFCWLASDDDDIASLKFVCKRFHCIALDRNLRRGFCSLTKCPLDYRRTGVDVALSALVVGDRRVGKTSFISRYLTDSDTKKKGFGTRYYTRTGCPGQLALSVYDLADNAAAAGERRMLSFAMLCHCVCVCVSLHEKDPLQGVEAWLLAAYNVVGDRRVEMGLQRCAPFMLVGLTLPNIPIRLSSEKANEARITLAKQFGVASFYKQCSSIQDIDQLMNRCIAIVAQNPAARAKLSPFVK